MSRCRVAALKEIILGNRAEAESQDVGSIRYFPVRENSSGRSETKATVEHHIQTVPELFDIALGQAGGDIGPDNHRRVPGKYIIFQRVAVLGRETCRRKQDQHAHRYRCPSLVHQVTRSHRAGQALRKRDRI